MKTFKYPRFASAPSTVAFETPSYFFKTSSETLTATSTNGRTPKYKKRSQRNYPTQTPAQYNCHRNRTTQLNYNPTDCHYEKSDNTCPEQRQAE
jgi:hypothetical protein